MGIDRKLGINSTKFAAEAFNDRTQVQDMSLLKGRAGMALVNFLLSKQSGMKNLMKNGSQMLDEISDNSHLINGSSFEEGFVGIGWAVEWLAQNDLMKDTNTDEILEAMDNELYKIVSYSKDNNMSLYTGTMGKIAYFLRRDLSCNPGTHIYKKIGHKECFVLLTDDLENAILSSKNNKDEERIFFNEVDLGMMLMLISGIKINVNKPTMETILYEAAKKTEFILAKSASLNTKMMPDQDRLNLLYLAASYLVASKKHGHNYWKERALTYIEQLTAKQIEVSTGNTSLLFKKMSIFSLLHIYTPSNEYREEIQKIITALTPLEMSNSLYEGRGNIVLSELCLQNKELIEEWDEIFFVK